MNNKGTKMITLAALIVGVVCITIGFAAFTTSLTIKSTAQVTPTNNFNGQVYFVKDASSTTKAAATYTGSLGSTATVSTDGQTLTISASKFTAPGQSETFTAHVYNASPYTAYVASVSIGALSCPSTGIGSLALAACKTLTLSMDAKKGDSIAAAGHDTVIFTVTYPSGKYSDESFTATFADSKINYTKAG